MGSPRPQFTPRRLALDFAPMTAPAAPPAERRLRIGIFDSGVGGLSILRAIRAALPHAALLYVADSGHAPYGDRDEDFVRGRTVRIADFLRAQGAQLLVVACNTATAAAVAALRARHPDLPVVGVEPGLKPALQRSRNQRIGVLATTGTLASEKFRLLAAAHAADAFLLTQPCPGLADAIEVADADDGDLAARVAQWAAPLREAGVDVAVLGCTHYAFAADLFAAALPGVRLIDTADAVARQALRLARGLQRGEAVPAGAGPLEAWSTGDPATLQRFARRWLAIELAVAPLSL